MIRILLAEDDEAMRHFLTRALEKAGHRVTAVAHGIEALAQLQGHHFDLLLSDIVMPGMDGIELAQHCTGIAPDTRVIFITGFAGVTLKAHNSVPEARVLSKPFHLRDLVAEVEWLFGIPSSAHL